MEMSAVSQVAVQTSTPQMSGVAAQNASPGGFMQIMNQLLGMGTGEMPGLMALNMGLLDQLQSELEEEGSELAAQMMSELMVVNPMLMNQMITDVNLTGEAALFVEGPIPSTVLPSQVVSTLDLPAHQDAATQINKNAVVPQTQVKGELVSTSLPIEVEHTEEEFVFQRAHFESMVLEAKGKTESKAEPKVAIDIDKLQKDVDSSKFSATPFAQGQTKISAEVVAEVEKVSSESVLKQTTEGIIKNLGSGKNEFVVKLKPEGLGEITVKLTEIGSKISLSIITSSEQTNKMLHTELNALKNALKPFNTEIHEIVGQTSAASSYLSSGNEFGGFARQNMFNQQMQKNHKNHPDTLFDEELLTENVEDAAIASISGLDVHI